MADSFKMERVSDTLPDFIRKIVNENQNFKTEFLLRLANEFLQAIRFTAPRDMGKYANSWVISKVDANSVTISTPQGDLAIYLEYGTAPHPIFPKRKSVLRWVGDDGKDHFALYVRHPGFPAKPHIRPSINVIEAKIAEIAQELIKKYFKL